MKKYFIPLLHLSIILAAWSSPFWLDWKIIVFIYTLYLIQNLFFGRCIISIAQFGNNKESFYSHYIHKFGIDWPTKKINFTVDYIIPIILILTSLIYQRIILI